MDRDKSLVKLLIVPSVLFLHLAVSPKYVYPIIIALAFGFLGDVFLLWPEKKLCFGAGLFSFLAGHLCYIFTICVMTGSVNVPPLLIIPLVIPYLLYDLVIYKLTAKAMGKLRIPSALYMGILNIMSIAALFYLIKLRNVSAASVFAGSLLFIASDTILGLKYFSQKAGRASGSAILITYAVAQLLIVAGLSIHV